MRQFTLRHPGLRLACTVALAAVVISCGKRPDSSQVEAPAAPTAENTAAAGPEVPGMVITYQTQMTPNQNSHPPGISISATRGQEIRYCDLANNRMRLEKYVFENSKKKLYETMIINETGSYRLNLEKNEAFFIRMTTPGPVWNFDDKVCTAWARQVNLTVEPEQFLGRTCEVVRMASSGNVWFWNEFPLKKEIHTVTSQIDIEAYKIDENASIPASLLQVPPGTKITSAD